NVGGHGIGCSSSLSYFFFFQAEDGIRDFHVTGVQTCALPICSEFCGTQHTHMILDVQAHAEEDFANWLQSRSDWQASALPGPARSEERRVGKEGRRPWRTSRSKEKEAKARKRLGRPSSPITSD